MILCYILTVIAFILACLECSTSWKYLSLKLEAMEKVNFITLLFINIFCTRMYLLNVYSTLCDYSLFMYNCDASLDLCKLCLFFG